MTVLSNRFVLIGNQEGQTINLGGHDFRDGVYEFVYVQEGNRVLPSQDDVRMKATNLERNYQAFPEGSPQLDAAIKALAKPTNVDGKKSSVREAEIEEEQKRSEGAVTTRQEATATREALLKLDHKDDEHWTDSGLPSVNAVRDIAGINTISRADIAALAPNLTRAEAKKVAEGGGAE